MIRVFIAMMSDKDEGTSELARYYPDGTGWKMKENGTLAILKGQREIALFNLDRWEHVEITGE